MLVHIVMVPDAARLGPDLTRVGKVEEVPDDLARLMFADGTGRNPTNEERAAFETAGEDAGLAPAPTASPTTQVSPPPVGAPVSEADRPDSTD